MGNFKSKSLNNNLQSNCYIGLGSNLNNPIQQLKTAINSLNELNNTVVKKLSSFYKTKPVGYLEQPDFINAVALINTNFSPYTLIKALLNIESEQKRTRSDNRNTPRTLDLDLLFYDKKRIQTNNLEVPHPRIKERAFVLVPLYEIAPKLVRNFLGKAEFIKKFKLSREFRECSANCVIPEFAIANIRDPKL